MAQYQIEISHTEQECLVAVNTIVTYGMHLLHHVWFGCEAGIHTGWLNIEVDNEREARGVLPSSVRSQARVTKVLKYTPEDIKKLHA